MPDIVQRQNDDGPGSSPKRRRRCSSEESPSRSARVPTPPRIETQTLKSSLPQFFRSPSPGRRHEDLIHAYRIVSPQMLHQVQSNSLSEAPATGESQTPMQEHTTPSSPTSIPGSVVSERSTPASPKTSLSMIEPSQNDDLSQRYSFARVAKLRFDRYTPLKENEIRLIMLHPAKGSMIRCGMLNVSLHEAPSYTAISYAWGDSGDQRRIELGGTAIFINTSLHGALGSIRDDGDKIVWVWADALCIDQDDRDEKSQQLRLMPAIYQRARSVAIWLGPENDSSTLATELLEEVVFEARNSGSIESIIGASNRREYFQAVLSLFERDYWDRLWVVQEVFNARLIWVYCGSTKTPWSIYQEASRIFQEFKADIEANYPSGMITGHRGILYKQLSYSQALAFEGPGSLLDRRSFEISNKLKGKPDKILFKTLLDVLRVFRRKLTGEPRDKVFGLLGVLPERIREEIPVNYGLSVKDVYTNVVETLLHTTKRLDVICDCIHFPRHTNSFNLPSWVPDWSYMPDVKALGATYKFSADRKQTQAVWEFKGERRNKLQISGIQLGVIKMHGIAVGTLCKSADYLMAFIHWRTILLDRLRIRKVDKKTRTKALEMFCLTISLGRGNTMVRSRKDWMDTCHHVFASMIKDRMPGLPLDGELATSTSSKEDLEDLRDCRQFLHEQFGSRMMGRCFFLTDEEHMGIGSGFMTNGDVIIVPFGCSTPIILRPEGDEFRLVGDAYMRSFMTGMAVRFHASGKLKLGQYVLH